MYSFTKDEICFASYSAVTNNLIDTSVSLENLHKKSVKMAIEQVKESNLPKKIILYDTLKFLGGVISKSYQNHFAQLYKLYGEDMPKFVAFATYGFHASVIGGTIFFKYGVEEKLFEENEETKKLCTYEGYIGVDGRANISYYHETSPSFISKTEKYFKNYKPGHLCEVMGLYWLNQVEDKLNSSSQVDLDLLGEAFNCFQKAISIINWDIGNQTRSDEIKYQRRQAGIARHAETYALKEIVKDYYFTNKLYTLNIEQAASVIYKANLVPMTYRTFGKWVSEFSKLHSASKV